MFIAAKDMGNAMDVMFAKPYFPENKEPTETASAEGTDKVLGDIFKEIMTLCGDVAQKTPATEETVVRIKDLFKEIAELKDMVEKAVAERNESTNAVVEESTHPEQKSNDIIESRVTGESGPATPMM